MHKNFYSVSDFHKILAGTTCLTNIYKQIKDGNIPAVYIGSRTLIPGYWVEDFCERYKITLEDKDNG